MNELRWHLVRMQRTCPGCGARLCGGEHLHHLFVRRLKPISDLLWDERNVSLVCPTCHVPEAPGMNVRAAVQKFERFPPDEIRAWIASLPTKVPLSVPGWFAEAESIFYDRN